MIEEQQLAEWERLCKIIEDDDFRMEVTCSQDEMTIIFKALEAVPALIAEVRKLNAQLPDSISQGFYHGKTIMEDKVARLEKEAAWLADHLEHTTEFCIKTQSDGEHCDKWLLDGACARCWRQAAMDACED